MSDNRRIAYFSLEMGLKPDMPTYAGGLGVLAGDTVRAQPLKLADCGAFMARFAVRGCMRANERKTVFMVFHSRQ